MYSLFLEQNKYKKYTIFILVSMGLESQSNPKQKFKASIDMPNNLYMETIEIPNHMK